jgi:hypothetical protein
MDRAPSQAYPWTPGYATRNPKIPTFLNPYTSGQCGGLCAVWLGNMYRKRGTASLDDTAKGIEPDSGVSLLTHIAGRRPEMTVTQVNQQMCTRRGLRCGMAQHKQYRLLGDDLAGREISGGYFISVGGHAIAVFRSSKRNRLASWETANRLYFFDPNFGLYYSDEFSFRIIFERHAAHNNNGFNRNPNFVEKWEYFKVEPEREDNDEPLDLGRLFG